MSWLIEPYLLVKGEDASEAEHWRDGRLSGMARTRKRSRCSRVMGYNRTTWPMPLAALFCPRVWATLADLGNVRPLLCQVEVAMGDFRASSSDDWQIEVNFE